MASNNSAASAAFPFFPILTLIFITLKLMGYITWSWFWVLSPTLIPLGIVAVCFLLVFVAFIGEHLFRKK